MDIDEEEPNCNICFEAFDDEEHSPRTLRCGHTLCTPCIDVLVKKCLPDRICPECRKTLKISSASHLPISYTILRLSRALTKGKPLAEVQIQVLDKNSCMKHGAPIISWCPLTDKWHCFKCVHADKCDGLLSVPEALLHIKQNYSQIVESKLSNVKDMVDSLKKEKEAARRNVIHSEKQMSEIEERVEKSLEWTKQLENDEAELIEAASTIRLTKCIVRLKRDVASLDSWLERSQPSVKSRLIPSMSSLSCLDIMGVKEKLKITQILYAVHESETLGKRWSKMQVEDSTLILHSLDYDSPPVGALEIPFEEVLKTQDELPQAFFDITCHDNYEGRVYFEMFGDTPRAKRFLKLCTGEEGSLYTASKLMEFQEDHHRFIRGGLPGGNILPDPIGDGITDGGIYRKALTPGLLSGWKHNGEYWSLFDIVLECERGFEDDYCFGKVVKGLSLLKGVCETSKNKKVIEIMDCGLIFDLL